MSAPGGLDELTSELIRLCRKQQVPVVFALKRSSLGRAIGKSIRVSVVGILSFDGAEEPFHHMLAMAKVAQQLWKEQTSAKQATGEDGTCMESPEG